MYVKGGELETFEVTLIIKRRMWQQISSHCVIIFGKISEKILENNKVCNIDMESHAFHTPLKKRKMTMGYFKENTALIFLFNFLLNLQ